MLGTPHTYYLFFRESASRALWKSTVPLPMRQIAELTLSSGRQALPRDEQARGQRLGTAPPVFPERPAHTARPTDRGHHVLVNAAPGHAEQVDRALRRPYRDLVSQLRDIFQAVLVNLRVPCPAADPCWHPNRTRLSQ